jgi:outer membrane protein
VQDNLSCTLQKKFLFHVICVMNLLTFSSQRTRMRLTFFLILFLALLSPMTAKPAHAQESLAQILTQTYETNPDLIAARSELRATNETYNQAISGWRPSISTIGSYGTINESTSPKITSGKADRNPSSIGLQATQPLYRGGRTTAATKASLADIERGRAALLDREQNILLATVTAYMDVVAAQAALNVTENNQKVLQRNLDATKDRFRVGEVTLTDVAQAESRLAGAKSEVTTAIGKLNTAKATFERLTGRVPGMLQPPDIVLTLPVNLDEAVVLGRNESPRVIAAIKARESARYQVREAKGSLLPEASLQASAEKNKEQSVSIKDSDTYSLIGRLTIPLYQSGAEWARVRQAQQIEAQRRSEQLNAERQTTEFTVQSWDGLRTSRSQLEAFSSQIKAAEVALDGVRQEALVGSRTVLDVLNAEQELLGARLNKIRAERDEVAQYTLLAATGRLTAASLDLKTNVPNPLADFEATRGKWFGFADVGKVD